MIVRKNNRPLRKHWLALLLVLFLFSCGNTEETPVIIEQDENLIGYLNRFSREAAERGVTIDFSNTEAVFVNSIRRNGRSFCGFGYSNYEGTGKQRIEISREQGCWNGLQDIQKENLFFHEIGHAYFARAHTEELLSSGFLKSMMCGDCNQFQIYTQATLHRRAYYIDELLDETLAEPEWGRLKTNFNEVWKDEISSSSTFSFNSQSSDITGSIDDSGRGNGPYSLSVKADERDSENFAVWQITLENLEIPQSSSLKLSATVNSVGPVLGGGLSIAIATSDGFRQVQFSSSERIETINGIMDNRKIEVNLIDYLTTGELVTLYLIWLHDTSGEVYFDDITLEAAED